MPGAEGLLGWLGGATLAGGGLTVVVLVLRRGMRRHLPPSVLVVLWTIVLLRLLVPVPEVRVWATPDWAESLVSAGAPSSVPPMDDPEATPPIGEQIPSPTPGALASFDGAPLLPDVLLVLWLLGFGGVAGVFGGAHLALRRRLSDVAPLDDPRIRALADDCRLRLGIRAPVGLFTTSGLGTPAVYGLLRPCILIPRGLVDQLSDTDWQNVLCHELAHVRRVDLLLQGLAALALAVHWFNPLVWAAWVALRSDTELACDRAVLNSMAEADRCQYGHTLLNLASGRTRALAWTPALAPWGTPQRDWKRRIHMIATHRTESRWKKGLWGALILIFGAVGLTQAQPVLAEGPTSAVTLTVTPSGKPRQAFSLSPAGFLKSKLYELAVGGAQGLTLNGRPLTSESVLADGGGTVVLDGQELSPPWVLRGTGDGGVLLQGQQLAQASNDGVAEWAGLASSITQDSASPGPEGPRPPLALGVFQPAELSFGFPEPQPRPPASGSPWVEVKDSNTVAQAVVSTVAEAQALVPWTLAVPASLPAGYHPVADIALFKDKWGHFFSSVVYRPTPATEGAQMLLLETDRTGWRPTPDGPARLKTSVGTVSGHWSWTWSELGSVGEKMVAVRGTELAWTKDNRSFLLIDSTGLSRQELVKVAASIR